MRLDAPYNGNLMFGSLLSPAAQTTTDRRFTLWIDGVGAWQILMSPVVTIGRAIAPVSPLLAASSLAKDSRDEADVAIMSGISRKHALVERIDESWVLTAHSATQVQSRTVDGQIVLPDDCEITLGDSVRVGFCVATPLSASARISFLSEHRPAQAVDGVVLMAQTCLLGPGPENHVCCPQWPASLVIARHPDGLAVKSRSDFFVDGELATGVTAITDGQVISGAEFRFRVEEINPKR